MAKPIMLRIGICECTTKYHGRLQGRRVTTRCLGSKIYPHPMTFTLHEFQIPEDSQQSALRLFRCHAFLDVHRVRHKRGSGYVVSLYRQQILQDTLGRERTPTSWRPDSYKSWLRKKPPTASTIIQALRELIQGMGKTKFLRWQTRMTPAGWKLPKPSLT